MLYLGNSKRCPTCKKYKDMATAYWRNKNRKHGVHWECKDCGLKRHRKYRDRIDRFWKYFHAHTEKVGECLEWTGGYDRGKPRCMYDTKRTQVPRLVYQLTQGVVPKGMWVLRKCNNMRCVRQSHLYLGTDISKEVQRCNSMPVGERHKIYHPPESFARGERNGNTSLTKQKVCAIRDLYREGNTSSRALGRQFGVSKTTVLRIVKGVVWSHV